MRARHAAPGTLVIDSSAGQDHEYPWENPPDDALSGSFLQIVRVDAATNYVPYEGLPRPPWYVGGFEIESSGRCVALTPHHTLDGVWTIRDLGAEQYYELPLPGRVIWL